MKQLLFILILLLSISARSQQIHITEFRYAGATYTVDDSEILECGTQMIFCHSGKENELERYDWIFFIKNNEVISFYSIRDKKMYKND